MRMSLLLGVTLGLALACSRGDEDTGAAPAAGMAAESDAPAPEPGAAPMPAANAGHDYTCADGLTFNARMEKGNAVVTIEGKTLTLTPGAVGAQYEGGGVLFIPRGNEATLQRAGEPVRNCTAK